MECILNYQYKLCSLLIYFYNMILLYPNGMHYRIPIKPN